MKIKRLLLLVGISFILCGCTSAENEQSDVVKGKDDIIAALKSHDNTSPYTYEERFESGKNVIVDKFSYNESTKKFTCSSYSEIYTNGVLSQTSVTITWIWDYLEDAKVKVKYINAGDLAHVEMNITDFSFSQLPYIDSDFDYEVTFMNDYTTESTIILVTGLAEFRMESAFLCANDFCTSIDGSLSIR